MDFRRILLFLPVFLILCAIIPFAHASQGAESEDPTDVRDTIGEDLSEKTDVELIAMERDLKSKLEKDPGNAELHSRISTVYATLFDRTRKQKGSQSQEWLLRGRDALEKVLMIRPQDKVAHYNLGVVYKRLGQMERSREELKKTIRLCDSPEDTYLICTAWLQIGSVYEEQGFFDEAKEAYLQAREFDYGNEDIQEAIRNVDSKRRGSEGGGGSPMSMSPMGSSFSTNPQTAAAMGQDPNAQSPGGIGQALPAIGQMLMQKFGGGGGGEDASGSQQ